jgi:23S rRNA (adenine2030-N6)-methyltransferase
MLSYRHAFHAGNFADVLKHWIQVEVLDYLARKDKPYVYVDTHSGAGLYRLDSDEASKNAEYRTGIGRLKREDWPELRLYLDTIESCQPTECLQSPKGERGNKSLRFYPGSPVLAKQLMRDQDKATFFELHPQDLGLLEQQCYRDRRIQVLGEDGFSGLVRLLPTSVRRGLVLMDPPYEVKSDYSTAVEALILAHRKMATATFALWYPVVERRRVNLIERQFVASGVRNIQLFELGIQPDTDERGMTSSGMILINPPYVLMERARALLPKLARHLAVKPGSGCWRCEQLVAE